VIILIWYAKERAKVKTRPIFYQKRTEGEAAWSFAQLADGSRYKLSAVEAKDHAALPRDAAVYQPISLLPAQYRRTRI